MKIYVGNLSYSSTEDDVRQLFAQFGQVAEVTLLQDKQTGKPRGFGFVDMPSQEEAEKAIAELNGKPLDGRDLKISQAQEKTDKPRRSFGGGGGGKFGGPRGGGRPGGSGRPGGRFGGDRGGDRGGRSSY